ncbi:hypothetical protein HHI36_012691 [Cryptolaemus montrouzieri]|uniref:Uncharacterized protein n=1 Tax=Cryptolaemus montrouzieri TaxID=559131 RepID=A0ABD2NG26_9CUCU
MLKQTSFIQPSRFSTPTKPKYNTCTLLFCDKYFPWFTAIFADSIRFTTLRPLVKIILIRIYIHKASTHMVM